MKSSRSFVLVLLVLLLASCAGLPKRTTPAVSYLAVYVQKTGTFSGTMANVVTKVFVYPSGREVQLKPGLNFLPFPPDADLLWFGDLALVSGNPALKNARYAVKDVSYKIASPAPGSVLLFPLKFQYFEEVVYDVHYGRLKVAPLEPELESSVLQQWAKENEAINGDLRWVVLDKATLRSDSRL